MGNRLAAWPVPGGVGPFTIAPDGSFYTAFGGSGTPNFWDGKGPGRITHLSASGTVLGQWSTEHIIPTGIAVAASGDVYVCDFYRGNYSGNPRGGVYRWSDH